MVKSDYDRYKVYYMALDYIALFSMLGNYNFSLGMSFYVTAFKIEEQEENINKKKDICQRQLLQNIVLLKFPASVTVCDTALDQSLSTKS